MEMSRHTLQHTLQHLQLGRSDRGMRGDAALQYATFGEVERDSMRAFFFGTLDVVREHVHVAR